MNEQIIHDRIIAKIQHYAEFLRHMQIDKEHTLLSNQSKTPENERIKSQLFVCQELLKEYYNIFDDILYR